MKEVIEFYTHLANYFDEVGLTKEANEITDKAVTEIVNGLPNLQLLDISACGRTTDKVIEDIRTRVPTLRLIR